MKINILNIAAIFSVIALIAISCNSIVDKTTNEADPNKSSLEGVWVSTDDAKSEIEIKGNEWIELYAGEMADTSKFVVADTCVAAVNDQANANGKYITVFSEDMALCYYIIEVSGTNLNLSYVGRGNTLTYKRKTKMLQ